MMKELSAKEMKRKEYSIYLLHKYLLLSCLYYSTVTDYGNDEVNFFNILTVNDLKYIRIRFSVSLKTSNLTKRYHYNFEQKDLYEIVKDLYENKGFGYRRISDYLISEGFRTVRSNKPILPNSVYSIYKKGKVREKRLNQKYSLIYHKIRVYLVE